MTIAKAALIGGMIVVATGGSAAVATKDKWWPSKGDAKESGASSGSDSPAAPTGQPGA